MAFGQRAGQRDGHDRNGLSPPLILVVVSLFVLMAFETGQAIHDGRALADVRRAQQPTMEQAIKLRRQLQTSPARPHCSPPAATPGPRASSSG